MKLTIGKRTYEEPPKYRFKLEGNKLTIVNHWNPETIGIFPDGSKFKIVREKYIKQVKRKLTEHKRSVII